ncbi:hypothetical protein MM221_19320 [Salipaludibacillus sp. LMS25]|uniref:YpoC family protein n=1 Tax=Salipaludibacillus sp. LMS25 TaxID=2924031 RepID=UPI0020D0F35D|nr:hypothetical protein [Salipaludibacillus sp. LMS25]UTR14670.1 hypothetical protein MM221_19320 [Salipaludibacillus sp. LMS25]
MKKVSVPPVFIMSPFYETSDKIVIDDPSRSKANRESDWFYEDILAYLNIETATPCPWTCPVVSIHRFLDKWKEEGEPKLTSCFQLRNRKAARPLMQYYTSSYLQNMQWVKQKPLTHLEADFNALTHELYAPVNLFERLSFVFNSINHYHAFTTLRQLIEESEKKWAVHFS